MSYNFSGSPLTSLTGISSTPRWKPKINPLSNTYWQDSLNELSAGNQTNNYTTQAPSYNKSYAPGTSSIDPSAPDMFTVGNSMLGAHLTRQEINDTNSAPTSINKSYNGNLNNEPLAPDSFNIGGGLMNSNTVRKGLAEPQQTYTGDPMKFATGKPQLGAGVMPNYANKLQTDNQAKSDQLQFNIGLQTSNSSNPTIALQGQNMVQEAMQKPVDQMKQSDPSQGNANSSSKGGAKFDTVGAIAGAAQTLGNSIGGTAGKVVSGLGSATSSINTAVKAAKAAKDGVANAGKGVTGGVAGAVGAVADIASSFLPEKTEYSGEKGEITQTMDSVYDGISDAAMSFGPIGMLVGGIMKGGKLLGGGVNALGGGTDGMCVCAGTKVFTANGSIVNIEDLKKEDGIIGWDKDNKQIAPQLIHNFIEPRQKECVGLTLANGIYLECSYDHPIFNGTEFIPAKDLTINDFVAVSDYPSSNTGILLVKVQSNKPIGVQTVYNLQADYNHTYLANGIITHNTTADAILGSSFLNLTPLGLINGFGGKKTQTITKDEDAFTQVGSSYTGSESDVNSALMKSGKKYGLISQKARRKADEQISEAKRQQSIIQEIAEESKTKSALKASMSNINSNRRAFNMQGGYDQASVQVGKHGMSIEIQPTIIELVDPFTIPEFQKGGSIIELVKESIIELVDPAAIPEFQKGGSVNVIPEGALHARKHNMDLDGVTKKGIPVVDNNGEQQAEIEVNELILRLEVTKKIEELEKKYYNDEYSQSEKDKFALKAGKLLVYEILHNTNDNTGIIDNI